MKTWLIKIGKVWAVLKRDGLLRGGRRVLAALSALFQPIGEGDILLISGGVGDSARYRTKHVAEELSLHGFRARVAVQDHPRLESALGHFQIFVLHRTLLTSKLAHFIKQAKALNKTIIFETDDLVYDPVFLRHMDYYHQMNVLEKKLYENGVGGEILADPYVEVATTTTSFLAEKLRERGKTVFVVSNKLSEEDLIWAEKALEMTNNKQQTTSQSQTPNRVRIGYLSGTPSHNKDFATITEALLRILADYPQVELVLAGPLDTESALNQYADRIVRLPFVPRQELFGNIASLDINLAPLEMGNPFCEAKSELKFFEAGIVKVPTVAAATGTFREAITESVDGYVAATTDEWYNKLSQLIENQALREEIGERAFETALERYTTKHANNEEYYEYLRSVLKN